MKKDEFIKDYISKLEELKENDKFSHLYEDIESSIGVILYLCGESDTNPYEDEFSEVGI